MEAGKVEGTRDAVTIIDGEMCKLGHEGVMEKLKEVTETEKLTDKRDDGKMSGDTRGVGNEEGDTGDK